MSAPTVTPPLTQPKRSKKRHANLTLDKMMEKFLQQSVDTEEKFYRYEEQRLKIEDKRREAEHARELQMLQMLGQMLSGISSTVSQRAQSIPTSPPQRANHRSYGDNFNYNAMTAALSPPIGTSFYSINKSKSFLKFFVKALLVSSFLEIKGSWNYLILW